MKLLFGTTNQGKLQYMRDILDGLNIELIGLNDIDIYVGQVDENGNDPLENAKIKASAYYKATGMPVFSCDSGLYINGLDDEKQPGVHVRRVNGKVLNDEEMITYYANLASKYGGEVKARYKNAICLVLDEENVYEYDGDSIASEYFFITSKVHPKRNAGFPLDSISVDTQTGKHYMYIEPGKEQDDSSKQDIGFRQFFSKVLKDK